MSVRHALLALLSEGPKYGSQLRQEFEAKTGDVWPLNVGPGVHDVATPRARRARRVRRHGRGRPAEGLPHHPGGRSGAGQWLRRRRTCSRLPADELVIKVLLAAQMPGVDVHERGPGSPPLPGRADAAVDPPQGGRGRFRPRPGPGRRRRALPARLRSSGGSTTVAEASGDRATGSGSALHAEAAPETGGEAMSF